MASILKTFNRAAPRTSIPSPLRLAPCTSRPSLAQRVATPPRRGHASGAGEAGWSKTGLRVGGGLLATAAVGAGVYYFRTAHANSSLPEAHLKKGSAGETKGIFTPTRDDYQKVYNHIAKLLVEKDDYDDGSYGPVLVRLAWHASGTYDAKTGTGGSNGATMRFAPEGDHGANAGLQHARDFLEPVQGDCHLQAPFHPFP